MPCACAISAEMDLEQLRVKQVCKVEGLCSLYPAHCWCGACVLGCSNIEEQDCWYLECSDSVTDL